MTDREQYKAVFSRLHASGGSVREETHMKKNHIRKGLVVAIAAAALTATAAGAANIATDGQFLEEVRLFFSGEWTQNEDGSLTGTVTDENGNEVGITVQEFDDSTIDPNDVQYGVESDEESVTTVTIVTDDDAAEQLGDDIMVKVEEFAAAQEQSETLPDGSTVTNAQDFTITENQE